MYLMAVKVKQSLNRLKTAIRSEKSRIVDFDYT